MASGEIGTRLPFLGFPLGAMSGSADLLREGVEAAGATVASLVGPSAGPGFNSVPIRWIAKSAGSSSPGSTNTATGA